MAGKQLRDSATDLAVKCHELWEGYYNKNERFKLSEVQKDLREKIITSLLVNSRNQTELLDAFSNYPELLHTIKTTNEDIWYEGLIESPGKIKWNTYWGVLSLNSSSLDLYEIKSKKLVISKSVSSIIGSEINPNEKNTLKLTVKINNKVYRFRARCVEECEEWVNRLQNMSSNNLNLSPERNDPSFLDEVDNNTHNDIVIDLSCSDDQAISTIERSVQSQSEDSETMDSVSLNILPLIAQPNEVVNVVNQSSLVSAGFLIIGMGSLLPWNFFIAAEFYWQYKLRDISADNSSSQNETHHLHLHTLWDPLHVLTSNFSYFIFLVINAVFFSRLKQSFRVLGPMVCMMAFFVVNIILAWINTDNWQIGFVVITVLIILIMNACGAVLVCNLYGIASMFPTQPFVMTAILSGEAISGVLASLARIVSLAIDSHCNYIKRDITIYFVFAIAILILSCLAYIKMSEIDFYQEYASLTEYGNLEEKIKEGLTIFKEIWPLSFSLFWIFFITLSVYPAICIEINSKSAESAWSDKYFRPVITFLLFNVCDLFGRRLARFCLWSGKYYSTILASALIRIVYIPLFLMCNYKGKSRPLGGDQSDYVYIPLLITFAFSNGFLMAVCMIHAPKSLAGARKKRIAGFIMAVTKGIGLLLGGIFSLILEVIT